MTTPNFKLLLNALRLGQPQDPQAAIRALAEEISAQEQELEEMRRRLHVAVSASNLLEAKAVRLERELEVFRARRHEALAEEGDHAGPLSRAVLGQHQAQQQPQHPGQQQPQHQSQQMHPPQQQQPQQMQQQPQQIQQAQQMQHQMQQQPHQHPSQSPQQHQLQQQPRAQPTARQPAQPDAKRAQQPAPQPPPAPPSDPSTDDGFQLETMVVSRQDLEQLRRDEAPFQITPAGQRAPAPARSIPGSPWTRARATPDSAPQSQAPVSRAPVSQGPASQPPSAGPTSKTGPSVLAGAEPPRSERPPRPSQRHEDDGETFPDSGGGLPSLAAALGLSPDDPRIRALRPGPTGASRDVNDDDDSLEESPGRRK